MRCCPSSSLPLQKEICDEGFHLPSSIAFAYNFAVLKCMGRLPTLSLNIFSAVVGGMMAIRLPSRISVLILYVVSMLLVVGFDLSFCRQG